MSRSIAPVARGEALWAGAWGVGVVAVASVPYLLAGWIAPPGYSFTGFLVNPADGFSYLAKMRDAAAGAWLVTLPYTHEPHPPALLYPQYILLGKFAALTGLPPIWVYHGSRVAMGLLMLGVSFFFIASVITDPPVRRTAFVLLSTGSGLTWLTSIWGLVAADAGVQISNTFHILYSNMHFPLSTTLLVFPLLIVLRGLPAPPLSSMAFSGATNALLALIAPFLLFSQASVGATWGAVLLYRGLLERRARLLLPLAVPALPAAGVSLQLYLNPVMREWTLQNIIPSPEPWSFALGYGLLLVAAPLGAAILLRAGSPTIPAGTLLVVSWLILGPVLVYLPLPWQRRLMQGYDLPLSILGAVGIHAALRRMGPAAQRRLIASLLAFAMLGSFWLVGTSLAGARALEEPFYLSHADLSGLAWLRDRARETDVVLASPMMGNVIPAWSEARVYWGHPFETIRSSEKEAQANRFYQPSATDTERCALVREAGITLVYWGVVEGRMGPPPAHPWLEPVYREGPVIIYRVLPCEVLAGVFP